jgi:hypothetical protein
MSNRRIWLTKPRLDGRPIADFDGLADETGETELYHPYGFVTAREGEALLLEVQEDADNHMALPPGGDRVAPAKTTLIYWKDTTIELTESKVVITVGNSTFEMDGTTVKTNMTIKARDFVTNAGVSLSSHTHSGVRVGPGNTGTPV